MAITEIAETLGSVYESKTPEQQINDGRAFPLLLSPTESLWGPADWVAWAENNKASIEKKLSEYGAILFRGFPFESPKDFHDFIQAFGYTSEPYYGGGAPRKNVIGEVHTSTESPAEFTIPFHHELAYLSVNPKALFFYCEIPPATGGETPLVLSNKIYRRLAKENPEFVEKVETKKLRYYRTMKSQNEVEDKYSASWEQSFGTASRREAEARGQAYGTENFNWQADNSVKLESALLDGVRVDPRNGKKVWFNSAHLLHPSINDRNGWDTLYGDGEQVSASDVASVARIAEEECVKVKYHKNDVLFVDNWLALHGRSSFTGPRRILAYLVN